MRDDVWSCLFVLVTLWFFASMTLILGFYGSEELQLGPSCSRLVVTNQLFVQSIKEWEYYLNTGSYVDISYDVKSPSYAPMSLVIAQGEENLIEWVDEPSYPNSTLSWNIIYGSGKIEQEIMSSGTYYIAIGNLNPEVVEWIPELKHYAPGVPLILVGTKLGRGVEEAHWCVGVHRMQLKNTAECQSGF